MLHDVTRERKARAYPRLRDLWRFSRETQHVFNKQYETTKLVIRGARICPENKYCSVNNLYINI